MEGVDFLRCSGGLWVFFFFQWAGPSVRRGWEGSGIKGQGGVVCPPPHIGGTMRPAMAETHTGNRKWVRTVSDWSLG